MIRSTSHFASCRSFAGAFIVASSRQVCFFKDQMLWGKKKSSTCYVSPKCMVNPGSPWSNGNINARLQALRTELDSAIRTENFKMAALIRDAISELESSATGDDAVTLANESFFNALQNCDSEKMAMVWMQNDSVSCTHPFTGLTSGYDQVLAGWEQVFLQAPPGQLDFQVLSLQVHPNLACVVCNQITTSMRARNIIGGEQVVTNLFQKQKGQWRLVHHHSSPVLVDDGSEENQEDTDNRQDGGESV